MSNRRLRLSRDQITRIVGNDPQAIKAFEGLLETSGNAWVNIDFTNSDIANILTRPHSALQSILVADETDADATKNKHVSNSQLKVVYDGVAVNATGIAVNLVSIKSARVLQWISM